MELNDEMIIKKGIVRKVGNNILNIFILVFAIFVMCIGIKPSIESKSLIPFFAFGILDFIVMGPIYFVFNKADKIESEWLKKDDWYVIKSYVCNKKKSSFVTSIIGI